jgi:two-component system cell cycle sensor histidine kinase/response regulator CckA
MSPSCSVSTFAARRARAPNVLHLAYSGEEALDKLCAGIEPRLRVILSDINMPVMDGLELLRQIKTRRPDLPVMTQRPASGIKSGSCRRS